MKKQLRIVTYDGYKIRTLVETDKVYTYLVIGVYKFNRLLQAGWQIKSLQPK